MTDDTILASDFSRLIREARMKKGFTHEQLANLMNERATLLRKYETGALKPERKYSPENLKGILESNYTSIQIPKNK